MRRERKQETPLFTRIDRLRKYLLKLDKAENLISETGVMLKRYLRGEKDLKSNLRYISYLAEERSEMNEGKVYINQTEVIARFLVEIYDILGDKRENVL